MKFSSRVFLSTCFAISFTSCKGTDVTPDQLHLASTFSNDVNVMLRAVAEVCQEKAVCPTEYTNQLMASGGFRSETSLLEIKNRLVKCDFSFTQDVSEDDITNSQMSTKNCGLQFSNTTKALKRKDSTLETKLSTTFLIKESQLQNFVSVVSFSSVAEVVFHEEKPSSQSQLRSQFTAVLSESAASLSRVDGQYEVDSAKEQMEYTSDMRLRLHFFSADNPTSNENKDEFRLNGKGHDVQNLETRKTVISDYAINNVSVDWNTFKQTFGIERN